MTKVAEFRCIDGSGIRVPLGAPLTAGVDVWVNTSKRPYEASDTSGMKAALNGVPSLSILDGWWIEGCLEGYTGWAIEDGADDQTEATNLYQKLEKSVVPLYLKSPEAWGNLMRTTVAYNGSFFTPTAWSSSTSGMPTTQSTSSSTPV